MRYARGVHVAVDIHVRPSGTGVKGHHGSVHRAVKIRMPAHVEWKGLVVAIGVSGIHGNGEAPGVQYIGDIDTQGKGVSRHVIDHSRDSQFAARLRFHSSSHSHRPVVHESVKGVTTRRRGILVDVQLVGAVVEGVLALNGGNG